MLQVGWDSCQGAGPAPSGKQPFSVRFEPFCATSVVPPTAAPGGENPSPGGKIPDPQGLPPEAPASLPAAQRPPLGRPAASFPAAQGLLLGHRGFLGISQEPPSLPAPALTGALWKPKPAIGDSFPLGLRFRPVSQAGCRANEVSGSVLDHPAQLAWFPLRKPKPGFGDNVPWIPLAATRVAKAS